MATIFQKNMFKFPFFSLAVLKRAVYRGEVPGAQKGAGGSHARSILKACRSKAGGGAISGVATTQPRAVEHAVSSSHRAEAGLE